MSNGTRHLVHRFVDLLSCQWIVGDALPLLVLLLVGELLLTVVFVLFLVTKAFDDEEVLVP